MIKNDQFTKGFSEHWDELIDWKKRALSEANFIQKLLKKYKCHRILDVATGTGYDSIQLLISGFDVTSIDGSQNMLDIAEKNAKNYSVNLKSYLSKWGNTKNLLNQEYDAIICLGNSLACELDYNKRLAAIMDWSSLLKADGILLLDHRNYDSILTNGINGNGMHYYLGENVNIEATELSSDITNFRYSFKDGRMFNLNMYPLTLADISEIFKKGQFDQIQIFGDRVENYFADDVNFYLHVGKKQE